MDAGYGSCILRLADVAEIVQAPFLQFDADGDRCSRGGGAVDLVT